VVLTYVILGILHSYIINVYIVMNFYTLCSKMTKDWIYDSCRFTIT